MTLFLQSTSHIPLTRTKNCCPAITVTGKIPIHYGPRMFILPSNRGGTPGEPTNRSIVSSGGLSPRGIYFNKSSVEPRIISVFARAARSAFHRELRKISIKHKSSGACHPIMGGCAGETLAALSEIIGGRTAEGGGEAGKYIPEIKSRRSRFFLYARRCLF